VESGGGERGSILRNWIKRRRFLSAAIPFPSMCAWAFMAVRDLVERRSPTSRGNFADAINGEWPPEICFIPALLPKRIVAEGLLQIVSRSAK